MLHLNLKILPKWNIPLKQFVSATPLNRSTEFRKTLCNVVDKHTLCTCVYLQNIIILFFPELWPKYTILCNLCETGEARMTEKQFSQISFWQWMSKCYTDLIIINRLCVSDYNWYLIIIFCPIVHHLCMTLPFIICSVVNQCWCVGYESLFTLSFISNDFASVKWYYCRRNPSFIMGKYQFFRWSILLYFQSGPKAY